MSDLLVRTLKYAGYEVTKVQNITDVGHLTQDDMADSGGEDKILKKAKEEKKTPFEIARAYEEAFIEDEKKLRILPPGIHSPDGMSDDEGERYRPRATEYIPQQIALAEELIEKGMAYEVNGSVYSRTRKFPDYGKLSKNKLEDLNAGARVEVNDEKEDPLDFALWKRADEGHLMQWDSPWGRGFPGWHIECSAMSRDLLGEGFDIHTGGEDNIFPHHECEIAQNEASCGHESVRYWLHAKHLLVDGQKMSKSKGNFYTVRGVLNGEYPDLIPFPKAKNWTGEELRFALLNGHYRTALNFTVQSLEQARDNIAILKDWYHRDILLDGGESTGFVDGYRERYREALFDDLNVPKALGVIFELRKESRKKDLSTGDESEINKFLLEDFEKIFEINIGETLPSPESYFHKKHTEIMKRIALRNELRAEKKYQESDELRERIEEEYNIEIIDKPEATTYRIKE